MKGTLFTILAYCAVVLGRPSDGDNIQRFWHLNETGFIGVNGTWSPAPLPPTLLPPLRKTAVHSVLYVPAQAKKSAKFGKLFVMLDVSVVFWPNLAQNRHAKYKLDTSFSIEKLWFPNYITISILCSRLYFFRSSSIQHPAAKEQSILHGL